MSEIPIYQVDAFASEVFSGNPAAVCPLNEWLPDSTMQSIAAENNLSETAFFVGGCGKYEIRWFTPKKEVNLCGHATLASAHVIFNFVEPDAQKLELSSKSGPLFVERDGDLLALNFPSYKPELCEPCPGLVEAIGRTPKEVFKAPKYLLVYENQEDVLSIAPDFGALAKIDSQVIVTAPGKECDFVSRFFAPNLGINEDPVTGSAHCALVPYWSKQMSKKDLHARQVSARGGELFCRYEGDRVRIAGRAALYLEGTIYST